jgi:hypothetical protein
MSYRYELKPFALDYRMTALTKHLLIEHEAKKTEAGEWFA